MTAQRNDRINFDKLKSKVEEIKRHNPQIEKELTELLGLIEDERKKLDELKFLAFEIAYRLN
ncbi:hypothetical protein ACFVIX_06095 [Bacillus subtilis]|jgi:hypothetical protein|uniref:hypothetical protein n=1 Tax=Bacillus subtilis group TaxID=653685 RepID=UPI00080CB64B|nr:MULTISPECIES: hypothetical protein [Bacillus subtilis group]MCB4341074.1 hypothetical protein [Bacillus subtilis]OCB97896.1 hypothetical protein SRCM101294_00814 [Bacillus amyloliquefaciens]